MSNEEKHGLIGKATQDYEKAKVEVNLLESKLRNIFMNLRHLGELGGNQKLSVRDGKLYSEIEGREINGALLLTEADVVGLLTELTEKKTERDGALEQMRGLGINTLT